jgi:hypothetical protein
VKKDNIIKFNRELKEAGNETTGDLLEVIANALDSVLDDDVLLVDVMEHLAIITAIMAKQVGISATTLMVCFAKTVEQIYEEGANEQENEHA